MYSRIESEDIIMKRILSLLLIAILVVSLGICPSADEWQNPFTDVIKGQWYYDSIGYTYTNNLFAGMSPTVFGVDINMTRAMFVSVLGRLDGAPDKREEKTVFTDVPTGQWYSGYIGWACENGIVYGTTPTTFEPNTSITREDMCVIIKRYADHANLKLTKTQDSMIFDDEAKISSYAKDAVKTLQEAGIIYGMGNSLVPKGLSTRAQVAAVIERTARLISAQMSDGCITNDENGISLCLSSFDGDISSYSLEVLKNADEELIASLQNEYGSTLTYDIKVTKDGEEYIPSDSSEIKIRLPQNMTAENTAVYYMENSLFKKVDITVSAGYISLTGKPGRYALVIPEWTPNY